MVNWKQHTIKLNNELEKAPVPIVWDGVIGSRGFGEGRLIPVLIIDTSGRPDIDEMVQVHKHIGPGEVETFWSRPSRFLHNRLQLILSFTRPSRCVLTLEFDVALQGGVLDQIIQAQGVYIQPGLPGDRIVSTLDNARVLVEVPSKQLSEEWERIYVKSLEKRFRKGGLSRGRAKQATKDFLIKWREVGSIRIPNS